MGIFSNKYLVGATAAIIALQILAVYNPLMQKLLRTAPLSLSDWLVIIPIAASIIAVEEIRKLLARKKPAVKTAAGDLKVAADLGA